VTLNLHKSALFKRNGVQSVGEQTRFKLNAEVPHIYVLPILLILLHFRHWMTNKSESRVGLDMIGFCHNHVRITKSDWIKSVSYFLWLQFCIFFFFYWHVITYVSLNNRKQTQTVRYNSNIFSYREIYCIRLLLFLSSLSLWRVWCATGGIIRQSDCFLWVGLVFTWI
jgi:hypothetical protein